MRRKYTKRAVLRSPMVVAGNNDKYIQKAFSSQCDAIIFDLEDGVPQNFKQDAREKIYEILNSELVDYRPLFVRLNALESGQTQLDIDAVACKNLDGVVYTKPYSSGDIQVLDTMLSNKEKELGLAHHSFKIIIIIETPSSVIDVSAIARSSKRVVSLLFGAEDLLGDMQGHHGEHGRSLLYARSQVLMACRAYGLIPIDAPYIQIDDTEEGLKNYITLSLELGYEGMLLVSPSQIELANKMYTPQGDQIEEAYKMVKISEENQKAGVGVSVSKRLFISPPTLKRAKNLIQRYEAIQDFEAYIESIKE